MADQPSKQDPAATPPPTPWDATPEGVEGAKPFIEGVGEGLSKAGVGAFSTDGKDIDPSGSGPYYCKLTLMDYLRPKVTDSAQYDPRATIKFPLPMEMRDDTDVSYTNPDMQTVGDAINGMLVTGPGAKAAALRNVGAILGGADKLGKLLSGGFGGRTGLAVYKLFTDALSATDIQPEQIASAASQTFGVAANPNPSVQFSGPALRTFSLTWQFNPRNPAESAELLRTIKLLKASALPTLNESGNSALLNYPRIVKINFFPWDAGPSIDKKHDWTAESIFRFGFCVMQSVNVNYAPSQAPAFFAGGYNRPVLTTISINFKEIEYLIAQHWDDSMAYDLAIVEAAKEEPDPKQTASDSDAVKSAIAADDKIAAEYGKTNNTTVTRVPRGTGPIENGWYVNKDGKFVQYTPGAEIPLISENPPVSAPLYLIGGKQIDTTPPAK